MAEKKARAPMELPDMPAQFEKDYMQATSETGPSTALLDKYDAASPRDLPRKILQAAEKAMQAKKTKKAAGGMTSTRKRVVKKQMGGMTSKVVPPTQINAGASVPPSQKSTMGMMRGGVAAKTGMARGGMAKKAKKSK